MKKTFTVIVALGALLLAGCSTIESPPTTTPAPTETPVPVLAKSVDDINGNWQIVGSDYRPVFLQFSEDGTYAMASAKVTNLIDAPGQWGQFTFEEGMLTFVTTSDSHFCAGQMGTWKVQLLEEGLIGLFLVEDECSLREGTSFSALERPSP